MKRRTKVFGTAIVLSPLLVIGFMAWVIYCGLSMGWNVADIIGEEIAK